MFKSKHLILAIILSLTAFLSFSQNFSDNFKALQSKHDTTEQIKFLKKWETAKPQDAELFIAYFNYYTQQSMTEVISIDTKAIGNKESFKHEILQKGYNYINKGIALYPARLDMRFGKVYMLGQEQNFPEFTKVLIETIHYGNNIKNAWTWKEGNPLEDASAFFLNSMQDYVITIYNTEDDNLLPLMRQISQAVLKYYPNHIESLSNVALTYLITADYDKALTYLLKAEKINSKDVIVLNNIAEAYFGKKDKANAKIYYNKIIKVGNSEEIENAKEKLKQL